MTREIDLLCDTCITNSPWTERHWRGQSFNQQH